jgi:tripartite-type tricarboxylate transporter receptor subunit TctC
MLDSRCKIENLWAVALSLLLTCNAAFAAGYPSEPVKIVVPIPPGAAADVLPRAIAEKLSVRFGQTVVVENMPGANSNIGARQVAKSKPDGYTLLATPAAPLAINQSLYPDLGFDPDAFEPVTIIAVLSNVLVVRPNAPFSSLADMLKFARANAGKLTYASAGAGSSPHLAMEWLAHSAGIQLTHVPYNGLTRALNDVVAGHVDVMFNNTANVLPLIRTGKLIPIAVDSEKRIAELADTPAVAEKFPGYIVTTWFAIVAPPHTPPEITSKLSSAIAEILRDPSITARLQNLAATPVGSSPAQAAEFIKRERERWGEIIKAANISVK